MHTSGWADLRLRTIDDMTTMMAYAMGKTLDRILKKSIGAARRDYLRSAGGGRQNPSWQNRRGRRRRAA
jgi:hypothetical protein